MATTLTSDEIAILLSAAGAAPSMHNTQPWMFTVDGVAVDVRLDADRTLPAEDPTGRWVRIGLGAAAFNLRVAAAVLGHAATVVTDPDPARPGPTSSPACFSASADPVTANWPGCTHRCTSGVPTTVR